MLDAWDLPWQAQESEEQALHLVNTSTEGRHVDVSIKAGCSS